MSDAAMALIVVGVVGCALAAGMLLNRRVRPFADSEVKGVKLEALVGPILSLTVLLLAFTLVNVFGSHTRAIQSAADEARKSDTVYELAGYLEGPERAQMQAAVTCYAAAVAGPEWTTMIGGRTAPEVSPWTAQMREALYGASRADTPTPVMSALLTADKERGEARSRRLTEARPSVPIPVFALLVGSAGIGIFALATFTLPYVARRVQFGVLALLSLLLATFVGLTWDMGRPYDGVVAVRSIDMTRVADDLREEWDEDHGSVPLPCDERGAPLVD